MARTRDARRLVDAQANLAHAVGCANGAAMLDGWQSYRAVVGELIASGRGTRKPIDVVPWWFAAHARQRGAEGGARLASSMALEIRSRIARGALRAGDHLPPLAALGTELGASRPSVREAARILENEQLVVVRPGSRAGAAIREPSTTVAARMAGIALELRGTTIADNWEARILVEPTIMQMAASRIGSSTVRDLWDICARAGDQLEDNEAFMRTGMDFRFTALGAAANPALAVTSEIHRWVATGSARAMIQARQASDASTNRAALVSYEDLVRAVERGAVDEVGTVWRRHVSTYLAPFRGQLGDRLMVDVLEY